MDYNYLYETEFLEQNAGALDLFVFKKDSHYLRSEFGGKWEHVIGIFPCCLQLRGSVSWVCKTPLEKGRRSSRLADFRDDVPVLQVHTLSKSKSFFSPSFEVVYEKDQLQISTSYLGEMAHDYQVHQLFVKGGWTF